MKKWLCLSLLAPTGFEEGISNFLLEHGASGLEELEEGSGGKRLKAYFEQDESEEVLLGVFQRYLKSLQKIDPEIGHPRIEATSVPDQDWSENWKRFFKPVRVTPTITVKPPWATLPRRGGKIVIEIQPGMAFGTGTHASTRLCLQALEEILKRNHSVLDVGTGSGILAIGAAKLGAREILGVDVDPVAVTSARENVDVNGVSETVRIRRGSLGKVPRPFDVVVANIDLKSLRRLRGPLLRHVRRGGTLILSGLLETERIRVRKLYLETGLLRGRTLYTEDEWVCLVFTKKGKRRKTDVPVLCS